LKYESGTIVTEKCFVIVHWRFSGIGLPVNWVAANILRIKDGILVEHWDVIQDDATQEQSKGDRPMFGDKFTKGQRREDRERIAIPCDVDLRTPTLLHFLRLCSWDAFENIERPLFVDFSVFCCN
jgi:hypothetical protein